MWLKLPLRSNGRAPAQHLELLVRRQIVIRRVRDTKLLLACGAIGMLGGAILTQFLHWVF